VLFRLCNHINLTKSKNFPFPRLNNQETKLQHFPPPKLSYHFLNYQTIPTSRRKGSIELTGSRLKSGLVPPRSRRETSAPRITIHSSTSYFSVLLSLESIPNYTPPKTQRFKPQLSGVPTEPDLVSDSD
jgi:hypothetical protein